MAVDTDVRKARLEFNTLFRKIDESMLQMLKIVCDGQRPRVADLPDPRDVPLHDRVEQKHTTKMKRRGGGGGGGGGLPIADLPIADRPPAPAIFPRLIE